MIAPDSAALNLTGAIPYFKRDARGLTELVQLRTLAHFGLRSSAGCAPNRSRQVRGFLKAQDRELAGRPGPRRRSYGRLKRQGLVEAAFGRVW